MKNAILFLALLFSLIAAGLDPAPVMQHRFFDSDGAPLVGGKVYCYEAGTTTTKACYTNASGTAQTQPIILDSEGYAPIWLGSGAYKFAIYDSADVLQFTVDNVDNGPQNPNGALVIAELGTADQTISADTATDIVFNTEAIDDGSQFNTTNGRFTASQDMRIRVSWRLEADLGATAPGSIIYAIYKNGSIGDCFWAEQDLTNNANYYHHGDCILDLESGDYITLNVTPASQPIDISYNASSRITTMEIYELAAEIPTSVAAAANAEAWATKTDGIVEATDYSSKAWAIGGTGVTSTATRGASKEWATETSSTVDGTEYSAKEYAQGTQTRGASGGGSAKDWAIYEGGTVDDTDRSAKYHAGQASTSATSAATSATSASSSATSASSSASAASTSATNAASSASAAAASAAAAAAEVATHAADTSTHGISSTIVGTSETQTLTNKTIDGDNNTISNLAHGAEVDNPSSGVHGVTGSVVGTTDSQTLTNKTLTAPTITSGVLNTAVSGTAVLDEDNMASDSATQLATQQSIKAYVDAAVVGAGNEFADNVFRIQDNGDATKELAFEVSGITTGTTRTITMLDENFTIVGAASTQTLTNKTLTSPVLNTGVSGTAVLDEDNMASDSATQLATQQSIKAYVDAQVVGAANEFADNLFRVEDNADDTKKIAFEVSGITTATTRTITPLDEDFTMVGVASTQTLTNKTLTSPVLNTGVSGTAVLDEDNMASDSATQLATQQSIKAYVDSSTGEISEYDDYSSHIAFVDESGNDITTIQANFTETDIRATCVGNMLTVFGNISAGSGLNGSTDWIELSFSTHTPVDMGWFNSDDAFGGFVHSTDTVTSVEWDNTTNRYHLDTIIGNFDNSDTGVFWITLPVTDCTP